MRARMTRRAALAGTVAALALAAMLGLAACGAGGTGNAEGGGSAMGEGAAANDATATAYHKITAEEAKTLMDAGDVTVVDVRTPQEYAAGHVPGAVNIPNEDIGSTQPSELKNLDDKLVVNCRTGVRSKQASDKLVAMGFTDVNDMGGIVDWPYDTVTGDTPNGA